MGIFVTCRTIRAVNLEIVPSLDTSSCVMRIEQFAPCRAISSMI